MSNHTPSTPSVSVPVPVPSAEMLVTIKQVDAISFRIDALRDDVENEDITMRNVIKSLERIQTLLHRCVHPYQDYI